MMLLYLGLGAVSFSALFRGLAMGIGDHKYVVVVCCLLFVILYDNMFISLISQIIIITK